ncbi:helix-turn-helix domain-containing protein [Acinetobacter calcoaceticus]
MAFWATRPANTIVTRSGKSVSSVISISIPSSICALRSGLLGLSRSGMRALMNYSWPGNIRQLKNALDRARVFADDGRIEYEHLPAELLQPSASSSLSSFSSSTLGVKKRKMNDSEIRELEKNFSGSKKELANYLGISERTLYRKLGSKE